MVTTMLLPLPCKVTRTRVPSGRLAWAAVIAFWLKISPLLVGRPLWHPPYQDACPLSCQPAGCPSRMYSAWADPAISIIDAAKPDREGMADLIIQDLETLLTPE